MSLDNLVPLAALYRDLATPPISPTSPPEPRRHPSIALGLQMGVLMAHTSAPPISIDMVSNNPPRIPIGSLLPTKIALPRYPEPPLRPDLGLVHPTVDSLTREKKGKIPALNHLLSVGRGKVMCIGADERYVFAGCQSADNDITVFSRNSLQPIFRLLGHEGTVLALLIAEEKKWLISSSSAGDIRIWSTESLQPVYIIHPCDDTSGDIYSLAWDNRAGGTLYIGSQSASIEWVNFSGSSESGPSRKRYPSIPTSSASLIVPIVDATNEKEPTSPDPGRVSAQRSGRYRPHSFFDKPPSGRASAASSPKCFTPNQPGDFETKDGLQLKGNQVTEIEIGSDGRLVFAHYGYVYALQMIPRANDKAWLVSGSGDGDVKVWLAHPEGGLRLLRTFQDLHGAVHSFAVRDSLLLAGIQDGEIIVWDLETGARIRTIQAHEADVLAMTVLGGDVYTTSADGSVLRLNEGFDCTAAWNAHKGTILSAVVTEGSDNWELITAGDDSLIKIWTIELPRTSHRHADVEIEGEGDVMLYALAKLIAVPTVSDQPHREDCRRGAHLLRKMLQQLGAQSEVLSGEQGRNPLVLATFSGKDTGKTRRRLLFYGHYDVQPAEEADWETNPWSLSGRNGYLYGRGVSDNKGPLLAAACAAATLQQRRELDVDIVMLIEGEEEAGSRGFASTVKQNKGRIGRIDVILLSNSTWINEDDPCVVFGMRGVVYAHLSVSSPGDDAHSGVDGGLVAEPMLDMVRVLGAIANADGVKLPGFYDQVRTETEEEMGLLSAVSEAANRSVEDLVKIWRQPSFSIASITSSGSANKTVIPRRVGAEISLRIVPDQDLSKIVNGLRVFCEKAFADLRSPNCFEIAVTHSASWWLASLDSPYICALEKAVEEVWGVKPLKIREGGTVPTISFLEQELEAPCVHLPLGQASDAGHLANERMRLLNLRNGKKVIETYISRLSTI